MRKLKWLKYITILPVVSLTTLPIVSCGDTNVEITFATTEGGSITFTSLKIKANTKWGDIPDDQKPIATADNGYGFKGWYVNGALITNDYAFTTAVTVTATFAVQHVVSFKNSGTGGVIKDGPIDIKVFTGTKWSDIEGKPSAIAYNGYDFKYWESNGEEITSETVVNSAMTVTPKFVENDVPIVDKITALSPHIYSFNTASKSYVDNGEWYYNIYQFNNSQIGYLCIDDFFSGEDTRGSYKDYYSTTTDLSRHITTITRNSNQSKCIIDYKQQAIRFEDYEKFTDFSSYGPLTSGTNGGQKYYKDVTVNEYVTAYGKVINLKDYGIKAYEYTSGDTTKGYLPYELFYNVFDLGLNISGSWDFNGNNFYQIVTGTKDNNQYAITSKQLVKAAAPQDFYNADYMQYCYDLLALTLDTRFGLKERTRRDTSVKVEYLKDGAYEALKPYKTDLLSTADDKSSDAIRKFFKENLDDGGHTAYINLNALSTKEVEQKSGYGDELIWKGNIKTNLLTKRYAAGLSDKDGVVKEGYKEYTNTDNDTIAYVTFDKFATVEDQSKWTTDEKVAGRELPSGTNESNYMNDTMRLTMYANKKIHENQIKNVVVDLSCNGGGAVYTEFFMASWLCGGVTEKLYNPKTNSYVDFTVKADVNGDGNFDSNDYITDVNLYVITSCCSFSCGNALPTNIQDNRSSNNTIFIGTKSGGGACYVDSGILLGANTLCQFSSCNHFLRKDSTSTKFISNDDGCAITDGWAIDDENNPQGFYDRATINNKIWGIE